jgi:hypothetical protein
MTPQFFFLLAVVLFYSCVTEAEEAETCDNPERGETVTAERINARIPEGCNLIMAKSAIQDAGWGVFSLLGLKRDDLLTR